ncbi:MAG: DUF1877 family protein [Streptosporangiaceae bacterium]
MGCLGVHFSFPADQGDQLWDGDEASLAFVRELEEQWDASYLQQTDKAWDAIHRCLADGTLAWAGGDWPLNGAVLGGEPMYLGRDYTWHWFELMRAFFRKTADEGRQMIFTADQ